MKTNGDCNSSSSNSEISTKRSTVKLSSRLDVISSTDSNNNLPMNTDNRIKFVDMLVCGSCQQDFQLSDIVKFIEHKAKCGNKENKNQIPYHYPQRRRHRRKGENDDDYDDDDDDEDDNKSQQSGNSSESESENHSRDRQQSDRQRLSKKQTSYPKVLVDASANTLNGTAEPFNFECSQCGDVYSTAWFLIQHYQHIHGVKMYKNCSNENSTSLPLTNNNNNTNSMATITSALMNNGILPTDPSLLNIDYSLLETAFKEANTSNRTLTSSSATSASNQLIAAANAARSVQKQQTLSTRTVTDSNSSSRGYHSPGINMKTNTLSSGVNASTTNAAYSNLFQDAARANPIFHFLQELAKQQMSNISRADKLSTSSDSQFLTPRSDVSS